MLQIDNKRFLSIQSHVVSGYCGNKCSTFPLQLQGFEVDVINSVQLSNHTQYSVTKGQIFGRDDLEKIHQGLKENNLLRLYDNILSGYVSDVGYIESMANLIKDIKKVRENTIYCLDPVLGDIECGYYVADGEKICKAYLHELIPLADIVTPNVFEAAKLTGLKFDSKSKDPTKQIQAILKSLHELGPATVALTSFELDNEDVDGDSASLDPKLNCILSHKFGDNGKQEAWQISIPKIPAAFYGTGDLFAALLTAWLSRTNFDRKLSLENTINTIQAILNDTYEYSKNSEDKTPLSRELRLVQNQRSILSPRHTYIAEPFHLL